MGGGATKPATAGFSKDVGASDTLIKFFGLDNSGKSLLLQLIEAQNRVASADDANNDSAGVFPVTSRLSAPQNLPAINIGNKVVILQDNPGHVSCREKLIAKGKQQASCAGIVFVLDVQDQLRLGVALNFLRSVIEAHKPVLPVLLVMAKRGGPAHDASSVVDQIKRQGVIPPNIPWKCKPVVLPEFDTPVGATLFNEHATEEKTPAPAINLAAGKEVTSEINWLLSTKQ